jgi:hypothetical protein
MASSGKQGILELASLRLGLLPDRVVEAWLEDGERSTIPGVV